MQSAPRRFTPWTARVIALAIIAAAVILAFYVARWIRVHPSSSDASIDAEVVHVAAGVGGRIIDISVRENAPVHKGALLFNIDPLPYQLVLAQAQADLLMARAQLDTPRRAVSTQSSTAAVARDATTSAQAHYNLAARTAERLRPLTASGYVPAQQLDQADVTVNDAATHLAQARTQQAATLAAIDTVAAGEAAVAAREAAVALAKRNLDDTTVVAPHDGFVVGLTVSTGEFVLPGQTLFPLVNAEDLYAVMNLRKTELPSVQPGDCATVYSMIDRHTPIACQVEGLGWCVADQDRINLPRSVPYVERSLNWVRVAQRFPVRIRLKDAPQPLMRLGASAIVEIKHGSQCR